MAAGKVHAVAGGITGLVLYGCYKNYEKEEWTFGGVIGAICLGSLVGLLPDIIESAANGPHHREIFHSVILLISMILAYNKIGKNEFSKLLVNIGLGGYVSHLILDSLTPMGLPIL